MKIIMFMTISKQRTAYISTLNQKNIAVPALAVSRWQTVSICFKIFLDI